jgi:hypothetical protein
MSASTTTSNATPAPRRQYQDVPASGQSRLFLWMLLLLLVRGLFSGWDLAYDFSVPKALKWGIDLAIYVVPGVIALLRIRSRFLLPATVLVLVYMAASLMFGIFHQSSSYGIEKSISLTLINAIEIISMAAVCTALVRGELVVPDRLLDALAKFGLAYVAASMFVGAYLVYHVSQGGEFALVGGRFFFVNPISLRMSSTFSEPSYLGFYVGFCALLFRSRFPTQASIWFIAFSGGVLFFLVGAKFAVIAYPLALLLGPVVHRMSMLSIRVMLYGIFIALFLATNLGLDGYVYRQWLSDIDYENQQTFVTRFAYTFSSLSHLTLHPLGTGFGGWMFTLPEYMSTTIGLTRGLGNEEIVDQLATGFNFAPKDSTSVVLLLAGWLGVVGFVEGFVLLLRIGKKHRAIGAVMVLYVLLSVAVYVNAIAVPMFFTVIVILIADLKSAQRRSMRDLRRTSWHAARAA